MAVEAKRYGLTTPLPLDETKSKLRDAAGAHPDLDLWILAASREIKEPDAGELRAEGVTLGIEVLLFDWPESVEVLPELLLLSAAHQDILSSYLTMTSALEAQLDQARAHPTYGEQLVSLGDRLSRPSLGYSNARDALSTHVREHMANMAGAALHIGRYANLTDPTVIRIDRPTIREAITQWWITPQPRPTLALLGGEGVGKTWAALSWWLDRELANAPLPLTLIVPARSVASTSLDELIGNALFEALRIRDADWWARRARRWCAGAHGTRIIVICDGLNERFDFADWSILAAASKQSPWKEAVEILVTDRGDHWRHIAGGFQSAELPYLELNIATFNDAELDEVLGRAGLDRTKLDPRLVSLMRVPRLCTLAIRHWERLGRSGDITPERLVYEDFRDRIYPELDDDEVRNLIARIGDEIVGAGNIAPLLRRQIDEALTEESGGQRSEATVSALVSGVWFQPIAGEPHRFRINTELAPVAMGLALTRAVQSLQSADEVRQRIEAFVDDLRGLELGVTVIGIAASFATIWPNCTDVARETLLDAWLASDNFYRDELRRYTRLLAEDPPLFLRRTERVWRDRQRLHDDRNIHLAGLVNAANAYPNVLTAFVGQATSWLSETFGWRDAMNGGETIPEVTSSAVAERVRAWNAAKGNLPEIRFVEPGEDWVSVASTTLSAISHLPREPFAAALGNYAVVTVITHELHYQHERFEWLLRANVEDAGSGEAAIISHARRLAEIEDEHGARAADLLLDALSSLDPGAQPSAPRQRRLFGRQIAVVEDGGALKWTYEPKDRDAGWGEVALRYATDLLEHAANPELQLDANGVALLRAAFEDVLAGDGDRHFHLSEDVRPVLARWAPDLLLRYLTRTDGIDTGKHPIHPIFKGFEASWVAHDDRTTAGLGGIFQATLRAAQAIGTEINANLIVLALCEKSAGEQLTAFRAMPSGPTWPKSMVELLKQPSGAEFEVLERILTDESDPRKLSAWLGLLAYSDLTNMPSGYAPVAHLLTHEDEGVRTAAMHVALAAPDNGLSNILRDTGWTAGQADGAEAVYGSTALSRADPAEDEARPSRVIPLALGFLSREWPNEDAYFQAFCDNVRDRVDKELNPPRTTHGLGHAINDRESYTRLVAERTKDVEAWLQPAVAGARISLGQMLFSAEKATIELCRALIAAGRPSGADVWHALIKSMNESDVTSDDLLLMPFGAPLNDVSDALRREALRAANLDQQLYDIASVLRRRDEAGWLISAIHAMLGVSVFDHAKALVLAGELDNDPDSEALWNEAILPPALPRWLGAVRNCARRRYVANIRAKHWLTIFVDANDPALAFSAFELFRSVAGRTCGKWATKMVVDARERMLPRSYDHWLLNVPALNADLKEANKSGKDHLAYTRVPRHDQAPWR